MTPRAFLAGVVGNHGWGVYRMTKSEAALRSRVNLSPEANAQYFLDRVNADIRSEQAACDLCTH